MLIEKIEAAAFGPFRDKELGFAPGLNVVYGPNEAGKSTWHAAIFAALAGMRRAKGQPRTEDREFAERHRPWDQAEWKVSAIIRLVDGSRIEVRQNLGNLVDCQAIDLGLGGRDVSSGIMNDGSPDATQWLGLDRRSFPATASVSQAEILSVLKRADALQEVLQKAVASAPADSTAASALERLEEFERDKIGTERAPTRPLRLARARVEQAERTLQDARAGHADYLKVLQKVDAAHERMNSAEAHVRAVKAARAAQHAEQLVGQLQVVDTLLDQFPSGRPLSRADDEELAREVATAIDRWERRPHPVAPFGETVDDLVKQSDALRHLSGSDTEVHSSVQEARDEFVRVDAALTQHLRNQPEGHPSVDTGGASQEDLLDYERRLLRDTDRPTNGLLSRIIVAIIRWFANLLGRKIEPNASRQGEGEIADLRRDLSARGLPTTPDGLRSLAQASAAFSQSLEVLRKWEAEVRLLREQVKSAEEALRTRVLDRGAVVPPEANAVEAWQSYELACQQRHGDIQRLGALEYRLQERRRLEGEFLRDQTTVKEYGGAIARLATEVGLGAADPLAGADDLVMKLREWQRFREASLGEVSASQEKWGRLQAILAGRSIEEVGQAVSEALSRSEDLARGVDSDALKLAMEQGKGSDGGVWYEFVEEEERSARDEASRLDEQLRLLADTAVSVPAAQEAYEDAAAEVAHLEQLANVIRRTREFMVSATERAHRDIAPILQRFIGNRLAQVTGGRYTDVLVDPETLDVKVRSRPGSGVWRSASLLSHGTAEQVYLLLRIALAEHLVRPPEVTPIILDDVTVQADTTRTKAILEMLRDLATSHQIILFSQEEEVAVWAKSSLTGPPHCFIELTEIPLATAAG